MTVARLQRNPTVKAEIQQKNFNQSIPAGFFTYPLAKPLTSPRSKGKLFPLVMTKNQCSNKPEKLSGVSTAFMVTY